MLPSLYDFLPERYGLPPFAGAERMLTAHVKCWSAYVAGLTTAVSVQIPWRTVWCPSSRPGG